MIIFTIIGNATNGANDELIIPIINALFLIPVDIINVFFSCLFNFENIPEKYPATNDNAVSNDDMAITDTISVFNSEAELTPIIAYNNTNKRILVIIAVLSDTAFAAKLRKLNLLNTIEIIKGTKITYIRLRIKLR